MMFDSYSYNDRYDLPFDQDYEVTFGGVRHGRQPWTGEYIYGIYSTYWGQTPPVHVSPKL